MSHVLFNIEIEKCDFLFFPHVLANIDIDFLMISRLTYKHPAIFKIVDDLKISFLTLVHKTNVKLKILIDITNSNVLLWFPAFVDSFFYTFAEVIVEIAFVI